MLQLAPGCGHVICVPGEACLLLLAMVTLRAARRRCPDKSRNICSFEYLKKSYNTS